MYLKGREKEGGTRNSSRAAKHSRESCLRQTITGMVGRVSQPQSANAAV